ncbi:molybdenum cofactor guanylyltransferase [Candidatus Bathyarchaeota archaeon]|nr:molybdenum cofactor guanylyltransferase [Candidatus Bathyarchaeota archaeon]
MDKTAVILAGGFSARFGSDKALVPLANKPLIMHVLEVVDAVAEEKIVVASTEEQAGKLAKALNSLDVRIAIDKISVQTPLVGALTGFSEAHGEYALVLPCDAPLISKDVLELFFDLCVGKNALIPRWPNGNIEPLHAVYHVKPALEVAERTLSERKLDMRSMIEKLRGIRYVSTLVLQQLDPELKTFVNVNTPLDFKRVEQILKQRKG